MTQIKITTHFSRLCKFCDTQKSGYMICIYQFAVEKSQILNSIEYE